MFATAMFKVHVLCWLCFSTGFADSRMQNLGVPWATSLLAFLTVALFPVPIVFYVYGAKIRKLSKFTPDL